MTWVDKEISRYTTNTYYIMSYMGKVNLSIDDKLEERFRVMVAKRKGMRKGNLTKAVEEAMKLWLSKK